MLCLVTCVEDSAGTLEAEDAAEDAEPAVAGVPAAPAAGALRSVSPRGVCSLVPPARWGAFPVLVP